MSLRPILTWPDARLADVASPVGTIGDEVRALAADMLETMYAAPGRGLAATQIGVPLRLFVMDTGWKEGTRDPRVLLNPEIVAVSDETAPLAEGCLSLPGLLVEVERPVAVRMAFTTLDGERREELFTGFAAVCVQHERDHLDGILTVDHLDGECRAAALARLVPAG